MSTPDEIKLLRAALVLADSIRSRTLPLEMADALCFAIEAYLQELDDPWRERLHVLESRAESDDPVDVETLWKFYCRTMDAVLPVADRFDPSKLSPKPSDEEIDSEAVVQWARDLAEAAGRDDGPDNAVDDSPFDRLSDADHHESSSDGESDENL